MAESKLQLGLDSFPVLRESGCYYVDKTELIYDVIEHCHYNYFARPNRFGKSLMISTMAELFRGNEELFRGLWIHEHWDWSVKYPVVRLNFNGFYHQPDSLEQAILSQLRMIAELAGIERSVGSDIAGHELKVLLYELRRQTGQNVVVLVDEFDRPFVSLLEDYPEMAIDNRKLLHGTFGMIKDSDDVHFMLVSGTTHFAPIGMFSGFNHLLDISMDSRYGTLCGFTEAEIETIFPAELEGLDRDKIRQSYSGYSWDGEQMVYNPLDVLEVLKSKKFDTYWFDINPTTLLYRTMLDNNTSLMELAKSSVDRSSLRRFDIDQLRAEALLFQMGFMTITGQDRTYDDNSYILDYPNYEIPQPLNQGYLLHLGKEWSELWQLRQKLRSTMKSGDGEDFMAQLGQFMTGIPRQWPRADAWVRDRLDRCGAWYAGLVYSLMYSIDVDLMVENVDFDCWGNLVIFHAEQIFVLETKVVSGEEPGEEASVLEKTMQKMRDRNYSNQYPDSGDNIHLNAIVLHQEKNVVLASQTEKI